VGETRRVESCLWRAKEELGRSIVHYVRRLLNFEGWLGSHLLAEMCDR